MDLPKEEPNRGMWVEWDNIPRCEGWNFPQNTKQGFGEQCNLRSKYRLKDKFDKTERFLCPFHLKTIGRLHYYYIEELEHKTIIRRETRLSWQKIQKDEIDKKRKIRNAKAKKDKKKKKKKKKDKDKDKDKKADKKWMQPSKKERTEGRLRCRNYRILTVSEDD